MSINNLKTEIENLVNTLRKEKKERLAECIEKNWNKTLMEYSIELNFWKPSRTMEKELLSAFNSELDRIGKQATEKKQILSSLEKRRVLQTAPHLGVTEGPRMLSINYLGGLGVPQSDFYIVGMFSGIPFSNRSRPGRINKKKDSINLFGSNLQDGLVYRSLITEKLIDGVSKLEPEIKKLLPEAKIGESYTKWALVGCANIETKILQKKNIIYIDINEVVTSYLIQVLQNKNHIFYKIFFDNKVRREFIETFQNEIMFYSPVSDGKYEQMENIIFGEDTLYGKHKKISLNNPENLLAELKDGRLCPAILTGFLALAFLNEFKCFGSFAQVEYLPIYQEKLVKFKFMQEFNIKKVPTSNLTTGTLDGEIFPVDIILGEKIFLNEKALFGEMIIPIKDILLTSYFTGDKRKTTK